MIQSLSTDEMIKLLYIIRTFMEIKELTLSMQDALWGLSYLLE